MRDKLNLLYCLFIYICDTGNGGDGAVSDTGPESLEGAKLKLEKAERQRNQRAYNSRRPIRHIGPTAQATTRRIMSFQEVLRDI
jgi:hypothetical protein